MLSRNPNRTYMPSGIFHIRLPSHTSFYLLSMYATSIPTNTRDVLILLGFLVSHLSEASVSALTAQLCGPNGPIYESEYDVSFWLGFGPHICLRVTPFSPKDKEGMRSFQKHAGNDRLDVSHSLPIALNLFSVESTAETLDDWLDGILDSHSHLSEYVNLMMGRHTGSLSARILQEVVSWFLEPGNKVGTCILTFMSLNPLQDFLFVVVENFQADIDEA